MITDPESGEVFCSHCGLVTSSDKVQESRAEWRTFDSAEKNDNIRVGSPTSLAYHDMGLSTVIGRTNKDSSGRKLDGSTSSTFQRLRTWDFRTQAHSPTDRNLMQAFRDLDRLKDKLGLSDAMVEKTAYIYRKAHERRLIKGRSTSSILAAAVYIACREMEATRTLRDIALTMDIKRKDLSRSCRLLVFELDIKMPLVDPLKCIAKISNKAKLSEKTKRMALSIMDDLVKKEVSAGKLPMGLAATALYLSSLISGENVSQKVIADAAGVTEVTIRNRFKDMKNRLPSLMLAV